VGVALIPEDRKAHGLVLSHSVRFNVILGLVVLILGLVVLITVATYRTGKTR
jgi:ABC-type sugar transport system ATPase subunit